MEYSICNVIPLEILDKSLNEKNTMAKIYLIGTRMGKPIAVLEAPKPIAVLEAPRSISQEHG